MNKRITYAIILSMINLLIIYNILLPEPSWLILNKLIINNGVTNQW